MKFWLIVCVTLVAGCRSPRRLDPAQVQAPVLGPALISNVRDEALRASPLHKGKRPENVTGEIVPSADGKWIAFASHRGARSDALSGDEAAAFARDPHSLDDIYVEREGGGGLKRLTRDAARNDQPAFSPDAKQVVFTHHAPDDSTAELFTVDVDDYELHQVTRLGAHTGRGVYHPGGDYVAFVTRLQKDAPASVLVIDRRGRHDPIVVAEDLGGEVVVEFEAHGGAIAWTFTAAGGRRVRRRAKWNDRLARRRLGQRPLTPAATAEPRAWIEYLADPYFEGRPTGGPREREYNQALAETFRELGLQSVDPAFEMPFSFITEVTLGERNDVELTLDGAATHLALSGDWIPTSFSATGEFGPAPVVFAGYGLVAPAEGPEARYDSFGDVDVNDKWVAFFAGLPGRVGGARRFFLHQRGRLLERALRAQARGAAGVLILDDPVIPEKTPRLRTFGRPDGVTIPVVRLARRQAEALFRSENTTVEAWAQRLADGDVAQLPLARASVRATVEFGYKSAVARNVLAQIKVPGAKESIVIGAHVDGLGRGERGGTLDATPGKIMAGANADASGVAALIGLVERLKRRQREGTFTPKQNVVFAVWSAGEMGAIGSHVFAARRSVSAAVNLRAVGGDRPAITARGLETSPQWPARVNQAAAATRTTLFSVPESAPDDGGSFARRSIPALTLTSGPFATDRTSLDTPERVNYSNLDHVIALTEDLVVRLTSTAEPAVFTGNSSRGRR